MSIEWTNGSPDEFRRKLRDPKLISGPARNFLNRVLLLIQGFAKDGAPRNVGRLWQSIAFNVDSSPMPLWGKVGTNVSYAPAMEYGTGALSEKPSAVSGWSFPSGPELSTWARRHGFRNGYIVANAIKKRGGLAARRYLRTAMAKAKPQAKRFLREFGNEIERLWSR